MSAKILVAVDDSEHSRRAVQEAARIAKAMTLPLTLVHATGPLYAETVWSASAGVPMSPETYEALEAARTEMGKKVLAQARAVVTDPFIPVDAVLVHRAPVDAVVELAQSPEVTLVVLGARGHSAAARVLLGSVADRIVHLCPKPVLVVP